ncbi:MAG TPA: hypothetical protein VFS77_17125, partial [Pyrinomonadaceae bacterium]|nr:hypothetical protein [Pyrinomonadaceae bacterium]
MLILKTRDKLAITGIIFILVLGAPLLAESPWVARAQTPDPAAAEKAKAEAAEKAKAEEAAKNLVV